MVSALRGFPYISLYVLYNLHIQSLQKVIP